MSIGGDHTVIGSSDHNAGSAYTNPNTFMICNKKLKEIYLSRSLPFHKHRAHEHKNSSTLPSVIPMLFTGSRVTMAKALGKSVKPLTSMTPIHVPCAICGSPR